MVNSKLLKMNKIVIVFGTAILLLSSCTINNKPESINLGYNPDIPQLVFAVEQITKACGKMGINLNLNNSQDGDLLVRMELEPGLGFEAYEIRLSDEKILISGGDANGLMYAGNDLAEAILLGKDLASYEM